MRLLKDNILAKSTKMKKLRVMIVSHPGTWQRVLQKSIEAYPFGKEVETFSSSLSAAQLIQEHRHDLILIDSSVSFDETVTLIQNMKRENPEIRSVVITDTTQQRRRAVRVGADYTVTSYNYEAQIGEVLDQLKDMYLEDVGKSGITIRTNPNPSK